MKFRRLAVVCALTAIGLAGARPASAAVLPGSNDPDCVSSHYPVVLVHGTGADATISWQLFSAALQVEGYCVWAYDLPGRATGDLDTTASWLADRVDDVLADTGAAKVSMIGHSQGGMQIRNIIKFFGASGLVDDAISLAGSQYGTNFPGASSTPFCQACRQQAASSDFYDTLNASPVAPDADYTNIETKYDEIVLPYTNAFLPDASNVTNVTLQDACPGDFSDHLGIVYDPVALDWALDALSHSGPADPDHVPTICDV